MSADVCLSWRTGRPARIVLVDDDPTLTNLWATILQTEGYTVTCCGDGTTALTAMNAGCDLLITDYHMPKMNGGELIRVVKQRLGIPCILMTGSAGHVAENAGREAGADLVVRKPIPVMELIEMIAKYVRMRPTA